MYTLADAPEQYFIEYDGSGSSASSTEEVDDVLANMPGIFFDEDETHWPDEYISDWDGPGWEHCWVYPNGNGSYFAYHNDAIRAFVVVAWNKDIGHYLCYCERDISSPEAFWEGYDRFVQHINAET
jgi:hypothetical protein